MRPRLAHRLVGVGGGEDPGRAGDRRRRRARAGSRSRRGARGAGPRSRQRRERRRLAQHALGQVRVQPHALPLAGAERPALVPDRVRDPEPAEVVHEPGAAQRPHLGLGQARAARRPRRRGRRPRARGRGCTATSGRRSSRSPAAPRRTARRRARRRAPARPRSPRPRSPTASRPDEDHVGLGARRGRRARGRTARRAARGRAPRAPRRRRRGARPRRTRRAARAAPRAGPSSPSSSPGQPRPSQRSYAAPSASSTSSGSSSCSPSVRAIAAWWAIMPSTSRWPESANSSPTRKRCSGGWPEPSSRMPAAASRRLRGSWSYLPDFSAMSSPNHFACSCASDGSRR